MKHRSPKTTAIRQRMEEVRCHLGDDIQEIAKDARELREWRSYVKAYPWLCVGAAVAVGYFIAPRHPRNAQRYAQPTAESTDPNSLVSAPMPPRSSSSSMRSALLAFVGNLVVRGVASYVGEQTGKLLAAQAVKPSQSDPP